MGKYNIGDIVRVRKNLKVGALYGSLYFINDMRDYRNREFKIVDIVTSMYVLEDCTWPVVEEMIEPVQEESKEEYTFQEVVTRIKPGETYSNTDKIWRLHSIYMSPSGMIDIDYESGGRAINMISISKDLKFKLSETKKIYTLYFIEHHPDGERYKFRSDNEDLRIGDFVMCNNTIHGKTFGRVANIVSHVLTKDEYLDIKECFPI